MQLAACSLDVAYYRCPQRLLGPAFSVRILAHAYRSVAKKQAGPRVARTADDAVRRGGQRGGVRRRQGVRDGHAERRDRARQARLNERFALAVIIISHAGHTDILATTRRCADSPLSVRVTITDGAFVFPAGAVPLEDVARSSSQRLCTRRVTQAQRKSGVREQVSSPFLK